MKMSSKMKCLQLIHQCNFVIEGWAEYSGFPSENSTKLKISNEKLKTKKKKTCTAHKLHQLR